MKSNGMQSALARESQTELESISPILEDSVCVGVLV